MKTVHTVSSKCIQVTIGYSNTKPLGFNGQPTILTSTSVAILNMGIYDEELNDRIRHFIHHDTALLSSCVIQKDGMMYSLHFPEQDVTIHIVSKFIVGATVSHSLENSIDRDYYIYLIDCDGEYVDTLDELSECISRKLESCR